MKKTPYEAWKGMRHSVYYLKVVECITYALVNLVHCKNMDKKSEKCMLVGYSADLKAYRLYNPVIRNVIISRSVVFNEEARWHWKNEEV